MEGRAQQALRASFPPGDAREDWAILRALSDRVGKTLPYDDLSSLRQSMIEDAPSFEQVNERPMASLDLSAFAASATSGAMADTAFTGAVQDYYLTNPIARASKTMAECSAMSSGAASVAAE